MVDDETADVDFNDSSSDAEPTMPVSPVEEEVAMQDSTSSAPVSYTTPTSTDEYVVQPGDTLSIIAKKLYNNAGRWQELASLNNLGQSQTIYPGDKIQFDSADSHAASYMEQFANSMQTVTVERGDSLSSISQRLFSNGGAWKYLYQLNAEKISNPDQIFVGQVLSYNTPTKATMTH
jgi:nucleoid-associated protein YgaU